MLQLSKPTRHKLYLAILVIFIAWMCFSDYLRPMPSIPSAVLLGGDGEYQSSNDDIRAILPIDGGVLAATGKGVVQYTYEQDKPTVHMTYGMANGLPSENCFRLLMDASGTVWVACDGGIAHWRQHEAMWIDAAHEAAFSATKIHDLCLSSGGRRIWVATPDGLLTRLITDTTWKFCRKSGILSVLPHNAKDTIWCRRMESSTNMDGYVMRASMYDLAHDEWNDVPEARHQPVPALYSPANDILWVTRGGSPPLAYQCALKTSRTWPDAPRWETRNGQTVEDSDSFGGIALDPTNADRVWCATAKGLWSYDYAADSWKPHLRDDESWGVNPLLLVSPGGKWIFWESRGSVSMFDVPLGQWTELWKAKTRSDRTDGSQKLYLSPDGKYLWHRTSDGMVVGDLSTRQIQAHTVTVKPSVLEMTDSGLIKCGQGIPHAQPHPHHSPVI